MTPIPLLLIASLAMQLPGGDAVRGDTIVRGALSAPVGSAPIGSAPIGRVAVEAISFPPLVFDPPRADEHEVLGVPVFHLHDPTLPLVDFALQLRGGTGNFPRESMAAVTALPALLRSGGTLDLSPDSVDRRIDLQALDLSFAGSGGGMTVGLNALTRAFPAGLKLLSELLLRPGFDAEAIAVWRGQELSLVERQDDDPASLAISAFNRLMFGDQPVGWVSTAEDVSRERFSEDTLRQMYGTIVCRDRLILGVSGDVTWEEAEPLIRAFLEPWPTCGSPLPTLATPVLRREGGVFVLPRTVEQSTVIVGGPGGVLQQDSPEFFASQITDRLLGGSGFGSRLLSSLRTNEGLAYGAYSVWTTSPRYEGIVGAVTATGAERTLQATRLLLRTIEEMRSSPPDPEEVGRAQEEIANGYVFAFGSPGQIVARRMAYRAQDLPAEWLERYLEGLSEVTPETVARVADEHLGTSGMTILIVGDPSRFDPGLDELGTVFRLFSDGSYEPWFTPPAAPGGAQ
ncbi:MAG: insulinase family protein [Gemmatimonadetes bacterium]|nr:insulinase family protein [Gemmatimonadota bacterium]